MQLIWEKRGCLRVLNLQELTARLLVGGMLTAAAVALLVVGAALARSDSGRVAAKDLVAAQQALASANQQVMEQESRLRAYSATLSRLQAHIIRLDALGQQVTAIAGLDPRDFSFDEPPAQGGRDPDSESYAAPQLNDFDQSLTRLSKSIQGQEREMERLSDLILDNQSWEQVRPAAHPVASGYISSYFGKRTDPLSGHSMLHKGLDYAASRGSNVVAVADGVVSESRHYGGFGNFVEIAHGRGIVTRYAHNQRNLVKAGQRVERGEVIALLGSTGRATGPNLHFEVLRDGEPLDPLTFIGPARR